MATRFELVLPGRGDAVRIRAAGEAALAEISRADERLSRFRSDSVIAWINREAFRRAVPVDGDLWDLLLACDRLHRETGGAFDAALGSVMDALRTGGREAAGRFGASCPRWAGVRLDVRAKTVGFLDERVQLDLGGIAKGFALDLSCEVLDEQGVKDYFIHGGTSTVRARGRDCRGRPFRVLATHPRDGHPLFNVVVDGGALSFSGRHGRYGEAGGHVLDPAAPERVPDCDLCVVSHPRALDADAWSTALIVRRLEGGRQRCRTGGRPEAASPGIREAADPAGEDRPGSIHLCRLRA